MAASRSPRLILTISVKSVGAADYSNAVDTAVANCLTAHCPVAARTAVANHLKPTTVAVVHCRQTRRYRAAGPAQAMMERASLDCPDSQHNQGCPDALMASRLPIVAPVIGAADTEAADLPGNQTSRKAPFGTIMQAVEVLRRDTFRQ